ncbi:GNAT family N-acetyltransferase [Candidatus Bathyarchaeota archaeon]|nr:GNAT family N-acetyltransferase [Candidatus Bathyarchaeota archaeon]
MATNENPIIIDVNEDNLSQYPPTCFLNPKNVGYQIKAEWLKERFSEGLKIKLLYIENDKKYHGFIEYVPGEHAWRAVEAKDYLFIHCIWVSLNKFKNKGYGSLLVEECVKDAEKQGKAGVAVIASDGPFMANKELFLKNGFRAVQKSGAFTLLVKQLRNAADPRFKDCENQLSNYDGLTVVYSNQCPWVARFMSELPETIKGKSLKVDIVELKTAEQAQAAPSVYAVFNLVNDGKLLADHYISSTRFLNILNKELKQ